MKRITVLVMTYNQEELIKRALNSILNQKEYGLFKVVVCDDCSKDNTWNVLKEYKNLYPNYLDIYRNEKNLGIYGNAEKLLSLRGESDLFCFLSGDDIKCDGYFKNIQEFICENHIDFSIPIGIFTDYKIILPDSNNIRVKQDIIKNDSLSLFSLYIRHYIEGISVLINNQVLELQTPTILDKGLNLAESMFDVQKFINIRKAYYVNCLGGAYYQGIGVSTTLTRSSYYKEEEIAKWKYFLTHYIKDKNDKYYAKANIKRCEFFIHPQFTCFISAIFHFIISNYPSKIQSLGSIWKFSKSMLSHLYRNILKKS